MEILKRARSGGEVVPFTENAQSVKEEADKRVRKAGYMQHRSKVMMAAPTRKYEENYRRIFGHE